MKCFYCQTFQQAKNIVETREDSKKTIIGKKFCPHIRKIIQETDDTCDSFEPTSYFWCTCHEQRYNIPTCVAKQNRKECPRKCRQKPDIFEIRKFVGRKRNGGAITPKLIVKRKDTPCPEVVTPEKKKFIIKRNTTD